VSTLKPSQPSRLGGFLTDVESYIASLESKMEKLEKKLAALESHKAPSGSVSSNGFSDGNSLVTQQNHRRGL